MRVFGLLLLLSFVVADLDVQLQVVELDPWMAKKLAAAAAVGQREAVRRWEGALRARAEAAGEPAPEPLDSPPPVDVPSTEPYEVLAVPAQVCAAAEDGAVKAVVVGAGAGAGAAHAQAAAARAGLPLLLVGDVPQATSQWEALALYPRADVALAAARELLRAKGWARAALLHAGSARSAALLAPDADQLQLLARHLPGDDALLRDLLLMLKKEGYVNFIIEAEAAKAARVLGAAQRVGLLAARHSYLLLGFETHTQDLYDYSHGGANITGLMFFNPDAPSTIEMIKAWREEFEKYLEEAESEAEELGALSASTAPGALLLAHDAALLGTRALLALDALQPPAGAPPASCAAGRALWHANTLLNYVRSEEDYGVTGPLTWEADGWRQNIILQVTELQRGGAQAVAGSWSARRGVQWTRAPVQAPPLPSDTMTNRTFKVLIAMNNPYVMKRESTERLSGNMRYEGFCIELIERLAEALHFNYTFIEQKTGGYGSYNKTLGEWQGMLRTVMDDKDNLTLAITDLTITEVREKVVDFTTPFMNLGIAILYRKPKPPEPEMFAFLLPFSSGVWLCLGFAYLGTSLLLYCVGRLCPEEWQNPYPCIEDPEALENQFTLGNALWFNLGAILLQGSEVAPVGYSTRAVASVWWFFALVITSSYTANLATLLAKKSSTEEIKGVNDLANNDRGIRYGAKGDGSTYTFFENAKSPVYRQMFENMKKWNDMPKENKEGIERVVQGNYAFLMESTSIEYEVERNCKVYMVGDLLDSKGYGIAMAKYSPYRQELNLELLRLQESGKLREMKHTWWEERNGGGACKPVDDLQNLPMEMNSFYGLFAVLVAGCAAGLALSCGDLAWHARRRPRRPDLSFSQNFAEELRFVFHFELSAKPLTGPLMPPKTPSAPSSEVDEIEGEMDGADAEEMVAEGEAAGGADGADAADGAEARCESALSGARRRRRSSMHTASMRLARHARQSRDAPAPTNNKR